MQKILNLYAGPGAGKSTTAAYIFAELKLRECNVELVREYAKDVVWEYGCIPPHITQEMILQEQVKRQEVLRGKVDLIITDSPLLLASLYGGAVSDAVLSNYDPFNVEVVRIKKFQQAGRLQNEEEAKQLDTMAKKFAPYQLTPRRHNITAFCDLLEQWINNNIKPAKRM